MLGMFGGMFGNLEEVSGVVVHEEVFLFGMFVFFGIGVLFRKHFEPS